MERTKRVVAGEISELFGPETLLIDKFMRQLGLRRLAEESWKTLDTETKETLTAYADGINDCVLGTNFFIKSTTGRLLPPEFYAFGITLENWKPWSPIDTIALAKYKSFFLSWNWSNDLSREALR